MSSTLTYSVKNHCSWRKKKEKVPSSSSSMIKWSLDLGFVFFSTPFPVLSYVSCLEAAKPSGRPVEPSGWSRQLAGVDPWFFPQWKTPGEVFSHVTVAVNLKIPELSQAEDLKLNVHVASYPATNTTTEMNLGIQKRSWRKACSRNKDLARSWREWWRESLRVKVWQGSTDLQRGYTIQVLGHKPR